MWQWYFVQAMFSPMFIEIKKRFKLSLNKTVKYTDGMTPIEIAEFLRGHEQAKHFFSNDLEK